MRLVLLRLSAKLSWSLEDCIRKTQCYLKGTWFTFDLSVSKGFSFIGAPHTTPILNDVKRRPSQFLHPGLIPQNSHFSGVLLIVLISYSSYALLCFHFRASFNCITICSFLHPKLGNHSERASPAPISHAL